MAVARRCFSGSGVMHMRLLCLTTIALVSGPSSLPADPASPPDSTAEQSVATADAAIERLIVDLGDDRFQTRRAASRELIRVGPDAIPLLMRGIASSNPEVSRRCQQVLDHLFAQEHRRMLEAFRANPEAPPGNRLPGWTELKEICGDTAGSRALLIAMHERESSLISIWSTRDSNELVREFTARCIDVQQKYRGSGRREVKIETVASLLFVGTTPRKPATSHVEIPEQTANLLNSLLYFNNVRTELQNGQYKDELKRLIAGWVRIETGATSRYQKLLLAMRYNLREGLVPAEQMIRGKVTGLQLQYALLAIGKLGDKRQLPLVRLSLNNASVLSQTVANGKINYKCEVRDVALAISLHLTNQDSKDYGFAKLRKNSVYLYSPNSAGFNSDATRDRAFARWAKYAEQLKQSQLRTND